MTTMSVAVRLCVSQDVGVNDVSTHFCLSVLFTYLLTYLLQYQYITIILQRLDAVLFFNFCWATGMESVS